MKLILRGHHLLCLQGFQGYGYDEDFIENMKKINLARKSEGTRIILTNKSDDICKSCPNLNGDLCENHAQDNRIKSMDNAVLSRLDMTIEYDAVDLFKKVEKIFDSKDVLSEICSNCMWHEKCTLYQKL